MANGRGKLANERLEALGGFVFDSVAEVVLVSVLGPHVFVFCREVRIDGPDMIDFFSIDIPSKTLPIINSAGLIMLML